MSRKILLIEDEKDIQTLVKMSLEFTGGHQVIVADNGLTGIEIAEEELPDVILLDVMMPKLDGFETYGILQDKERTKNIPVIFLTAKAQKKEVEQGLQLGAIGYLIKPFDAMKLNEELESLLSDANL
ncbi:response regulator [bacterium]|nr:response regulator [bacterium]